MTFDELMVTFPTDQQEAIKRKAEEFTISRAAAHGVSSMVRQVQEMGGEVVVHLPLHHDYKLTTDSLAVAL